MFKNIVIFGVFAGFLIFAILTIKDATPEHKEKRIYTLIHKYSPYQLEKRFGGLSIIDKNSDKKEKPPSSVVLHRLDELEKQWASKYMTLKGNSVLIKDSKTNSITKIPLQSQKEKDFVIKFYNLKIGEK